MTTVSHPRGASFGGLGGFFSRIKSLFFSKDWTPSFISHNVVSLSGAIITGVVMVKRDGQTLVYREPTEVEAEDFRWLSEIK